MSFAHLHCHSHFTLLESTTPVGALVTAAADAGMPAVALTDRGNLFGALEFQEAAKRAGIKGIVGCQLNIAPLGMRERTPDRMQLVVLAQNSTGYHNLARMVSQGWLDGFYYEPRVDLECLAAHNEGLICLTGAGEHGFLNRHLLAGAQEEAQRQAGLLKEIFDDRLYVELTRLAGDGPAGSSTGCIEIARGLDLPLVASNWVHYLTPDGAYVHDVQLAVQKVTTLADTRRKRMDSQEHWLKPAADMEALFADVPEACANTLEIVERCTGDVIETGTYHLPKFECPDQLDENAHLKNLCEVGMIDRYGNDQTEEMRERLDFELKTISGMGFAAYFLIVSDFINWAKNRDIPVGPGRGSAAGSIVAYALGITDICPLRYGLLFERFLNPGRISMPDIDIDFCKDRRGEVIEYVAEKYGREAVVQIMTLGTMKARMAIKDVSRAYEWTPEEAQELANLVPEDPTGKHTIPVCLGLKTLKSGEKDPSEKMVARYDSDDRAKTVLDTAMALENLGRSLGVHACGVIIAPGPVQEYMPVCTVKGKPASQYNMTQCEDVGLLKMDFLGLKTMSILKKAIDIVRESEGKEISLGEIPLDDPTTFKLLGEGDTLGVFQCESSGFRELIKMLKPDRFEDMIALVALYRPGPLMANMHIQYCDRKHGRELVDYPHPVLEEILQETFGLYIYQEQVMNISRELCGFSPSEADNLRKAMGKKKLDVLEKMKEQFVNGAFNLHEFPKDQSEAMWEKILGFASYCFNKSHSACYGLIAYWTAWLKANHYPAFMTANLIYEMGNKDKMTLFIQELRDKNIDVLPPDVNESGWEFTWTGEAVRFGFGGVKGVGEGAAHHLMKERQAAGAFTSLYNVCERIDTRTVNKRVIEHLVRVGAFDSQHTNRRALSEAIDRAFDRGHRLTKAKEQSQTSLFGAFEQDEGFREQTQGFSDCSDWSEDERLGHEKALTGYWMSSHPIELHGEELKKYAGHQAQDLASRPRGEITIAAVVVAKREIRTRKGRRMCVLTLEDMSGRFEAVLFPGRNNRRGEYEAGPYERFADECAEDLVALFTGNVDERQRRRSAPAPTAGDDGDAPPDGEGDAAEEADELPSLIVKDVVPAELLSERLTTEIIVAVDAAETDPGQIAETEALLKEHPGHCPIQLLVQTDHDVLLTLRMGERWHVHPSRTLLTELRRIWSNGAVTTRSRGENSAFAASA